MPSKRKHMDYLIEGWRECEPEDIVGRVRKLYKNVGSRATTMCLVKARLSRENPCPKAEWLKRLKLTHTEYIQAAAGKSFDEGWPALGRWLRAVAAGKLLRWIRGVSELAGRALAERVSAVLAEASGVDARSASFEARVWAGVMSSSRS